MDVGTHTTGALGKMLGIPRIAPLQDNFQATEKLGAGPGIDNFSLIHLHFNLQMPLDAGHRIHHDGAFKIRVHGCIGHRYSPFFAK